ncbi:MAG: SsrA-binding protein [Gammaproteobacteria bacterium]|nr:MAG: SsrA-binding protein [Gammaproteobacteria bacterium]
MNKKKKKSENTIAENRRARFNFELTNKFEAGVSLEGWEVRSIRLGKAQIAEAYVLLKDKEAWLIGCHLTLWLIAIRKMIQLDPENYSLTKRNWLKSSNPLNKKGQTCVPTKLFFGKKNLVKCEIALAKR